MFSNLTASGRPLSGPSCLLLLGYMRDLATTAARDVLFRASLIRERLAYSRAWAAHEAAQRGEDPPAEPWWETSIRDHLAQIERRMAQMCAVAESK